VEIESIKNDFLRLSDEEKIDIVKFVVANKPSGAKLRDIMRGSTEAAPFDLDLIDGQVGEIAFLNLAMQGKIESKRDFAVSDTGNIALEFEYKGNPSCIATTKAPFWVYWLSGAEYEDEVAVVITVNRLRRIAALCRIVPGGDNKASRLYLIPVTKLLIPNRAIKRAEPQDSLF